MEVKYSTLDKILWILKTSRMVWIIGNGGSAAIADHFACDLLKNHKIPAISLCSNNSLLTAIANDHGVKNLFVKQLQVLMRPEFDSLIAFSTRGNSANIVNAMKWAFQDQQSGGIIGISGYGGGKIRKYCNIHIDLDSYNMQECEDKMAQLCHYIAKKL